MTDDPRQYPPPNPTPLAVEPEPAASGWGERQRPVVAGAGRSRDAWLISSFAVLLGLLMLLWLGSRRTAQAAETRSGEVALGYVAAPPTPSDISNYSAPSQPTSAPAAPISPLTPVSAEIPLSNGGDAAASAVAAAQADQTARLRSPALVVDLGDQASSQGVQTAQAGGSGPPTRTFEAGAPPGSAGLNGDEQFARRVGAKEADRAEATRIDDLRNTIPQGALIPGVLETALNSDLPGYTRAVVSRDVRGFDGTAVLIPRGSRVIGEYKSAPAEGQSRAFIVWTRIIRPDGVSIQIGSSGTDPLGRAGLAGSVNRHILQRFGGAILLSVIDAEILSLARQPSTQVVIGSTTQAIGGAGGTVVASSISPTIKVPQGAPIRIFVARDLDFSSAERLGP